MRLNQIGCLVAASILLGLGGTVSAESVKMIPVPSMLFDQTKTTSSQAAKALDGVSLLPKGEWKVPGVVSADTGSVKVKNPNKGLEIDALNGELKVCSTIPDKSELPKDYQ